MLDMGIIKVEINLPELRDTLANLAKQRHQFFEKLAVELKDAASSTVNELLNAEITSETAIK